MDDMAEEANTDGIPIITKRVPIEPGIYDGVDFDTYKSWDAVNKSSLDEMWDRSALHYKYRLDNPEEETDAMVVGSALHTLILEPEEFDKRYLVAQTCSAVVKSTGAMCTKDGQVFDGKRWFCGIHGRGIGPLPGIKRIGQKQSEIVYAMAAGILKSDVAKAFINDEGRNELSIVWDDRATGIRCKGRIDLERIGSWGSIGDLKTTESPTPWDFSRSISDYAYDRQAAWYIDGATAVGIKPESFVFICPEKKPPYDVGLFRMQSDAIAIGREQNEWLLKRLQWCRDNNAWPPATGAFEDISVPRFHFEQVMRRLRES
jgi:hypothetical protein